MSFKNEQEKKLENILKELEYLIESAIYACEPKGLMRKKLIGAANIIRKELKLGIY